MITLIKTEGAFVLVYCYFLSPNDALNLPNGLGNIFECIDEWMNE